MTDKLTVKRSVPVLMYHSVSSQVRPGFREFTVSPELFAEHMSYLRQHQYTPITVTRFVKAINGADSELPWYPVVLTFDDGFTDFHANALPILERYGFAATLYIVTAFVGDTSRWLKRAGEAARPMLTWSQLAEISASGIECGAHSHSHPPLDTLPAAVAYDEIIQCKMNLEDRLAQKISTFAYPYGYYTPAIRQMVRAAGYSSACAVKYAVSSTVDDPFSLARLMVTADTRRDGFAALLTGRRSRVTSTLKRARTSIWQLIRRCRAQLTRVFKTETAL